MPWFCMRPVWDKVTSTTKHVTNSHKSSLGQTSKVLKTSPLPLYKWIHVTLCFVNWQPGWRMWLSQKLLRILHAAQLTSSTEQTPAKSHYEQFPQLQKWSHGSQLQVKQLSYLALVEMDHINTGVVTGQLDKGKGKKRWCNEQVLTCLRAKSSC